MNTASTPTPGSSRAWLKLHEDYVCECKSTDPDVVFIGDSLVQYMALTEVWDKYFKSLNSLNFGIAGDTTQNVLWRVTNGEMDTIKPKVIVLLVGTNNVSNTDTEVVDGILTIAEQIHYKQTQAQLIILGIPPKGRDPNSSRLKIEEINKGLKDKVVSVPGCMFLPTDPKLFVNADGGISDEDMFDYLHLTSVGYSKICEPLRKVIEEILGKSAQE